VVGALLIPIQGTASALDIFWAAIVAGAAAFLLTSRPWRRP
jgi:hypothetical protein